MRPQRPPYSLLLLPLLLMMARAPVLTVRCWLLLLRVAVTTASLSCQQALLRLSTLQPRQLLAQWLLSSCQKLPRVKAGSCWTQQLTMQTQLTQIWQQIRQQTLMQTQTPMQTQALMQLVQVQSLTLKQTLWTPQKRRQKQAPRQMQQCLGLRVTARPCLVLLVMTWCCMAALQAALLPRCSWHTCSCCA
jgi:hypothetical protein